MDSALNSVTIPNSTTFLMASLAMLNTVIPLLIAYHYRKRLSVKISTFFIGLLTYMLFAMLLVQLPDLLIRGTIKPFAELVKNSPLTAAIYFSTLTALVEEGGRFFIYKTMMKNRMTKEEALMLGAGHGGIQAMFVGSSVMMSNAILAFSLNSLGAENYVSKLGLTGEKLETTTKGIIEFGQIPASSHFFDGTVPLILMVAQIALSYIVFRSIVSKTEIYLFPLAILMHIALLLSLYLVRKGVTTNVFVPELIMLLFAMAIIYFAYVMYQKKTD